jgi:hypothetical protein
MQQGRPRSALGTNKNEIAIGLGQIKTVSPAKKKLFVGWLTRQERFAKCTHCLVVNRLQLRDPTSLLASAFFNWETLFRWPTKKSVWCLLRSRYARVVSLVETLVVCLEFNGAWQVVQSGSGPKNCLY